MKTQSGLTLIELMVALSIVILVLAIGVPSFVGMMSTNQAAGYANDLVGAIRLARSEAIKRADSVTICASNADQTDCSGTDWQNGWIVFADNDADGTYDGGEEIVRVWSIPTDERSNLTFEPATTPTSMRFISTGANSLDAQIQFAFKKSDCAASQARQITVSRLGRTSINLVTCF